MDLEADEKTLIPSLTPPVANNITPPLSAYCNKKIYEMISFSNPTLSPKNKPINILYDKNFYGKVDLEHNAVAVDKAKLKSKMIGDKKVSLMNFVMDAQTDFFYYWDFLKKTNKLSKNSILYNIGLTTGSVDFEDAYFSYMNGNYASFTQHLKNKKIEIRNFDHFLEQFINFVDFATPSYVFTFSSFVTSRMADPHISGLCFDVKSLDAGDDNEKFQKIITDPNYAIFKKTATKHGFFIDKHVPWRLYADIDSPAMIPYMQDYALTQDNLYTTNFQLAMNYDLYFLKNYLVKFYNTTISTSKVIQKKEFKICEKTGNTVVKHTNMYVLYMDDATISNNPEFDEKIMKLYVYLKGRENNYNWDQNKFDSITNTFIELKQTLDLSAAMRYVWPLVKLAAESETVSRTFFYRRG